MIQFLAWRGHIANALDKLGPIPHFTKEKAKSKEAKVSGQTGLTDGESLFGSLPPQLFPFVPAGLPGTGPR